MVNTCNRSHFMLCSVEVWKHLVISNTVLVEQQPPCPTRYSCKRHFGGGEMKAIQMVHIQVIYYSDQPVGVFQIIEKNQIVSFIRSFFPPTESYRFRYQLYLIKFERFNICSLFAEMAYQHVLISQNGFFFSSADSVSSAELMVLLIVRRPSSVLPSTFALNRYSSYSSYSKILNFLLEKLGI